MADTTFVNGVTLTDADWFNDVNDFVYAGTAPGTGTQSGQTTFTLTGCSTSPTYVGKWTKQGNVVTLSFPNTGYLSGTSNSTGKTLTGLDVALRPSNTITGPMVYASDNGAASTGGISIASSGVITLGKVTPTGNWTNSGGWDFYFPTLSWTVA